MVDLRSDTATHPTAGMRAAIAAAAVGDEQKREDPTVNELEERAAQLLGQDEAIFLPTATMANQIALRLHTQLGDELIGEENCHVFISELGGPAVHSGVVTRGLPGEAGRYTAEQVRAAYRVPAIHSPRTRVLWVENTHNASGGRIWPLEEIDELRALALELELRFHLDGARLMNAAVATGIEAAEIGGRFDTVTLCLSKGLGCPLGALLAGRSEVMGRRAAVQAPLRRCDAPGGDRRGGGGLRARASRRPARRGSRAGETARARPGRGGPVGRPRPRGDELRSDRCGAAVERGGDGPPRRAGCRALGHDSPDRAAGGHAPRRRRRGHRRRPRADPARARRPVRA